MPDHLKRSISSHIKNLLKGFPCVALLGARQVGKSTLLKDLLPKAAYYDLEKTADYDLISADVDFFFRQSQTPLVIDEAQSLPQLFNGLRVAIDHNRSQNGLYLISGSSSPALVKSINESLAGRVAIVEISGLSFDEALKKETSHFYKNLLEPKNFSKLKRLYSDKEILDLCMHGSYPEAFLKRKNKIFYNSWYESYIKTYIERDLRQLFPNINLDAYRRFILMLAFSSGEIINISKFATALEVSQPTIKKYFEIAEGTFLWRRINSFEGNGKKRLLKASKGYFRDTGLINYFLKILDTDMLLSHPHFGRIWEIFVTEQILKNIKPELINYDVYYYRTKNAAEIDLVLDIGHSLIPIEIKASSGIKSNQLLALKDFIQEYKCPYGLVINNGEEVRQIAEKIYQVPVGFI
ncbi:MAG: ATP-binding protein [bacterium]